MQHNVPHQERPIEMPKPNAALVLGKLCWCVQSTIYKYVLPPWEYDKRVSYKSDYMEENVGLLADEAQTSKAKQAWKQVLEILNWKEHNFKRLARAMRMIQGAKKCCFSP